MTDAESSEYKLMTGLYAETNPIPETGMPNYQPFCHDDHQHNNYCTFNLKDLFIQMEPREQPLYISLDDFRVIENNFQPSNSPVFRAMNIIDVADNEMECQGTMLMGCLNDFFLIEERAEGTEKCYNSNFIAKGNGTINQVGMSRD